MEAFIRLKHLSVLTHLRILSSISAESRRLGISSLDDDVEGGKNTLSFGGKENNTLLHIFKQKKC